MSIPDDILANNARIDQLQTNPTPAVVAARVEIVRFAYLIDGETLKPDITAETLAAINELDNRPNVWVARQIADLRAANARMEVPVNGNDQNL